MHHVIVHSETHHLGRPTGIEGGIGLVIESDEATGVGERSKPLLGETLMAAISSEERAARHRLSALHLLADRRLGTMDAGGRGGEANGIGHGDEAPGQIEVEVARRGGIIRFPNVRPLGSALVTRRGPSNHDQR
ncbi:hypothetical protein [Roseomonas nepalensis]|nr:hypothetical protein [Roseomonas nepalensis]